MTFSSLQKIVGVGGKWSNVSCLWSLVWMCVVAAGLRVLSASVVKNHHGATERTEKGRIFVRGGNGLMSIVYGLLSGGMG